MTTGIGGKAPAENAQDVANGGATGRCDDADALREVGQCLFAVLVKQAFIAELQLQRVETALQDAFAGGSSCSMIS